MANETKPLNDDEVYYPVRLKNSDDPETCRVCPCMTLSRVILLSAIALTVTISVLAWDYFNQNDICENPIVIENSILHKGNIINPDINPCDDFYSFACGRWNLSISSDFISVFEETEVRNLLQLESYLKCSSFDNANPWSQYMKYTYELCENGRSTSIRKSRTVAFVRNMASALLFNENRSSVDITLQRISHPLLQTGLFTWNVNLDKYNDEIIQVVKMMPPTVVKGKEILFESRTHLEEYIREVLMLLGAEERYIMKKCEDIVDIIMAIKRRLNETSSAENLFIPKRMEFEEFVTEYNAINFRQYFSEFSSPKNVSMQHVEYFNWLERFIRNQTLSNNGALQDYLIWTAIDYFIPYMPKEFLSVRRKYSQRDTTRMKDLMEESHACVHAIKASMNFAASSYFMERTIDNTTREMVYEIVLHVKSAFRKYLNGIRKSYPDERKWFTGVSRVFKNIEIGVPTHFRKIYEDGKPPQVQAKSFPAHFLSALRFSKTEMMNHFDEPPYGALYQLDFMRVNGIFMTIPMLLVNLGILTPPVFHPDQPIHLNYAGLGFVLSHELAHSVIYLGTNNSSILQDVLLKLYCLRYFYANSTMEVTKSEEDLADAVGVQIAYNAFLEHYAVHKNGRTPATVESKLFFLHYSQFLCESGSTFSTEMSSVHSPFKSRVNVPLSNFPVFSDIFACPNGSAMNKGQRCF